MKQEIKERVERIRKGEVSEGYRKTKNWIIPSNWDETIFSSMMDGFSSGSTPSRNNKSFFKGDNLWITSAELNYNIIENSNEKITDEAIKKANLKVLNPGTFVIAITGLEAAGTRGSCGIVGKKLTTSQSCMALIPKSNLDLNFLFQFYCAFGEKSALKYTQGTKQQSYNGDLVRKLPIIKVPLIEQQKIAKILSTWDKAIELKERLIEEKKELKIVIVNNLIFGLKRFDEFIKSHKYNHTKYINIPEDWGFIKIGEIATEVSEKNGNNDKLPVLSCTKHSGLVDSLTYFKKRVFSKDTSTYKQVKMNQFVYATNHIDEGSIGFQNLHENSLVSPMYTVFKTNSKVNNNFLFSLLKTRLYIFIYQVNMSASVDRRGSLRWDDFSKIKIPLPDISEQNKIVETIQLIDNNIGLLNTELNQLKEQKRGLMQLLLTGIVRVEVN